MTFQTFVRFIVHTFFFVHLRISNPRPISSRRADSQNALHVSSSRLWLSKPNRGFCFRNKFHLVVYSYFFFVLHCRRARVAEYKTKCPHNKLYYYYYIIVCFQPGLLVRESYNNNNIICISSNLTFSRRNQFSIQ